MRPLRFRLVYFLLGAHLVGCAGLQQAAERRRIKKAHATLEHYQQDTPPAEQLADLLQEHPALAGTTVRTVRERDTVRLPAVTVAVAVPAVSTPAADLALVDSLMRAAGRGLHAKDSATFAAKLRAELAARPRLSRDTVTRTIGPVTLALWVDAQGRPRARVVKVAQAVAYEKTVQDTRAPDLPKPELGFFPRLWLFIQDAAGVLVLLIIGGVVLVVLAWVKRRKPGPTT